MTKEQKELFLNEHQQEINYIVELINLYKEEGLNRLKIWKEFRNSGTNSDLVLAAFRIVGFIT